MADEQVKYGSIVVLHKDGPSPRPHSLKLGPTTIGSSVNSDIRVKTILSRTVQCIITTKDNGLVTVENKSKANPVFLNGTVLKTLEVLIDGDKFEVAGRAFQYINNQQKNRKDLMKILEKSTAKRQTVAAVMPSSSKIPVSLNASRIPVKKKRSLSLSESKENKRTTLTRLCSTSATSKRTTSLASPGHGLRKVLFDETSKDQCGPSPFLALNSRTRRSQSLTDRSLIQDDLTTSHTTSVKSTESVNDKSLLVKSPSLSLQLPDVEKKPKTPKTPKSNTSTLLSARKSMKKISEECNIENESIDLIDFDVSNVEGLPLPQNEEAQISCDDAKSGLISPQSNTRVGRSKSQTPVIPKSPIKRSSTAAEITDRTDLSVNEENTLVHESSQNLSEIEEFVSPQKDDQENPQEEDEIPSPIYEAISPNGNGFGNALAGTLNAGNSSTQPVTDDDSTFFTPSDSTLNNSNKSDSFQLQLETSTESAKEQIPSKSPSKSASNSMVSLAETSLQRDKSRRSSKSQTPIVEKRRNSRKYSSVSSTSNENEIVEETLVSLNNSLDSNLVSIGESIEDSSALEASTPKWTKGNNSTAVFTRSGRKCSLPLKFREFESVSSTPKSAVKKRNVESVTMETTYEMNLQASEASLASTVNSTCNADFSANISNIQASAVNTSNSEIGDDVLKHAPVGGAKAKSLTPVKAKMRLYNKSLPMLQAVDFEESVASLPKELELSTSQSVISVSDVSQSDTTQSDANNSVIFNPIATPSAIKLPASPYKTPPSVQMSNTTEISPVKEKSVRFSDTYVPKPRTPITRLKIRSLTPASVKRTRLNMPFTAIGLPPVTENLENSISQQTEDSTQETPQTLAASPRKSNRMSTRKTFGDKSSVSEQGGTEEQEKMKADRDTNGFGTTSENGNPDKSNGENLVDLTPHTTVPSRSSTRMSSRKSSAKETSVLNISDSVAGVSSLSEKGDTEESNNEEEVKQTPQTSVSERKSTRMSSRKSSAKETSVFNISDSVAEPSNLSGKGNTEESNNEEEAKRTPQTLVSDRKSARMSSRKSSAKETSVLNISDSVAGVSSLSEKGDTEESNNEEEVKRTPQTSVPDRKSARMSARKSSAKETSIFNISDSVAEASNLSGKGDTEESNNEEEAKQTPQTSVSDRKSTRMSPRKSSAKETSVFNISDSVAGVSSFSEKGDTEESNTEGEVQQSGQTSVLSRKSGRVSPRKSSKTRKETSVLNISDTVASSFSEGSTEEQNYEGEVEQTPQASFSSRKSARMSSRQSSKIPKETSVFNKSDTATDTDGFSEKGDAEETNNEDEVEQTPEASFSSRKSARMSSRRTSRTPKETSVLNISDPLAGASSFSEGDTEEQNYEGDVEQDSFSRSRKSARMSSRKTSRTPKGTSVFNISDTAAEASSFSEKEDAENFNNEGEVEQTPEMSFSSRKSSRMSSRKTSKTPKETSVLNISNTVAETSSFSEEGGTEEQNYEGDVEQASFSSSRKSARMSSRKTSRTPKETSVFNISDTVAEASSFAGNGDTEDSNDEGEVEQTSQISFSSRKSTRMSSRKSSKTPKETSVFNISDSVAEACEKGDTEESNNEDAVQQTAQTSILTRKSGRMSSRKSSKTPKETPVFNISNIAAEASSFSEEPNNEGEVIEQTPEASFSSRKSARMSSRKTSRALKETSVLNISDTAVEPSSFSGKGDIEETNNDEVEQTPKTSFSSRKSTRMSSRKSSKTPKVTSEDSSFSAKRDTEESDEKGEVTQTPQTSFSSRKGAPVSSRKVPRESSIINISDVSDAIIAADHNYSLSKAEVVSNEEGSPLAPHISSSSRKSVRMSSRKTPKDGTSIIDISDVAASFEANDSVIDLIEKTPLANVRHVRAKSQTPSLIKIHSTNRKRSLPLLQKTLRKVALAAITPSSAKSLGRAETPVTTKFLEKAQTPARKSLKRASAGIVDGTPEESPVHAMVQQTSSQVNEETLAARKSSRMSTKKSASGVTTPIQHPRGIKRARETPATVQNRKRRKLDQSTEHINASMNSFYEEPSVTETPKSEHPHKSPLNDLTEVSGVKQLMKTPRYQKPPLNDLSDIKGVKQLLATPKIAKSPENDLTKVAGVKRLMKTPKPVKSPLNDLSQVKGVKKLMRTPRVQKSPNNDLQQVAGVKKMFASPKLPASPLNDLTNVEGVKDLMKLQNLPRDDLTDVEGVDMLFAAPQRKSDEIFDSLFEKKQVKTYQRKSFPGHVLGAMNKAQRASSANQPSCSPRVNQWVEESLQHLVRIKQLEGSKSVDTENKRATPQRASRGKLPSRYLETDYVFSKVVTPKVQIVEPVVENNEKEQSIDKLAGKEIIAATENKNEERVTRKRIRADEEESGEVEKVSKNKRAKEVGENINSKDHLGVPQRATGKSIPNDTEPPHRGTKKRIQSNPELTEKVVKSRKTKEPTEVESDAEINGRSRRVTRNKPVQNLTPAPVQKALKNKGTVKTIAADSENDESAPPRSTRKATKKETLKDSKEELEDATQKSVKNKRIAKNSADSENDMPPPRSTRKGAKKETSEDLIDESKDAPQKSVKNKRTAKSAADSGSSENEEMPPPRSTRKAAKKETLGGSKEEAADAPQKSVKNKRILKSAVSSENEEATPPRSTRKAANKETLKNEPADVPQRSVTKRTAKNAAGLASSENEEKAPPRSTRKAGKKETIEDFNNEHQDLPQRSTRKRKQIPAADSLPVKHNKRDQEELAPPKRNKRNLEEEKEELAPPKRNKRNQVEEKEEFAPPKRNKRNQEEEKEELAPPKRNKRNQVEEKKELAPPTRSTRPKQTKEAPNEEQQQKVVEKEKMKNKALARSTRNKEVLVESEPPSTSQKRPRRQQDQEDKSTKVNQKDVLQKTTRHRKQEVEETKQKTVTFAKSTVVEQQKTARKTRKESEKVTENKPSPKAKATRKQTAATDGKKGSTSKTAINVKVQTISQPRAAREKLPLNTRSTRSSKK